MVKTSRSTSVRGGKGKGGAGSGAIPPSPTRRLKKGGKRGRRLCHMDGCTLCPSFGFEGEVAVSCSHHKSPGMRNLTARRCQHEGCFTVANFGMPGDKPGYCAAHSTTGMVNRNKPRGAEGMLAGVPIARSSRRAAKANTVLQGLRLAAHTRGGNSSGTAGDAVTTRSSYNRTHYAGSSGTESLSGQGSASGEGGDGAESEEYGMSEARTRMLRAGARSNGGSRMSYGEDTQGGIARREDGGVGDKNMRRSINGGKVKGISARDRIAEAGATGGPGSALNFISRGEDPPEPDMVPYSYHSRRVDASKGINGASRVRGRGGGAAAAAMGMQLFHTPVVAAAQEAYLAVHCGGLKAAQMGHAVDSIMLGEAAHQRAGNGRTGVDIGFPGDLNGGGMIDGSKDFGAVGEYLIDSTVMDGNLDGPLGMGLGGGIELLGSEGNVDVGKVGAAGQRLTATSRDMNFSEALRCAMGYGLSSGNSLLSGGRGPGVRAGPGGAIGCQDDGGGLSDEEGESEDFGDLVNLQGLGQMDFKSLGAPATSGSTSGLATSAVGSVSTCGPANMNVHTPGVSSTNTESTASSSMLRVSTMNLSGSSASCIFVPGQTIVSTPPPETSVSVPTPLPSGGVLQGDDGWWDVLEREEFVAMPEPIWGVCPTNQGLGDEPTTRGQEDCRVWRGETAEGTMSLSARGAGSVTSPGPLEGGENIVGGVGAEDGKDSLQEMLLGPSERLKPRTLLSSSPSIGDGMEVSTDGFSTIEDSRGRNDRGATASAPLSSPGFPMLSGGGGRLTGGRDDVGDVEGLRSSPMKRRQRFPGGDTDTLSLAALNSGSALRPVKRDAGSNGLFLSSTPSMSHTQPGAFGLTVTSGGPLAPAGQSQLINSAPPFIGAIGSGGGGGRTGLQAQGGHKTWGPADQTSPSKFLSASPSKRLSASPSKTGRPSQSTSPWATGGICPPHQTQAAGRA